MKMPLSSAKGRRVLDRVRCLGAVVVVSVAICITCDSLCHVQRPAHVANRSHGRNENSASAHMSNGLPIWAERIEWFMRQAAPG
jgi:hypothetical protein